MLRVLVVLVALVAAACPKSEETKSAPKPLVPSGPPLAAFEKRYGGIWVDVGTTVVQMKDGGFALTGDSEKVDDRYKGDYDAYIVRVDGRGEAHWSERVGELMKQDIGHDLVETPDGGLLMAGFTGGKGAGKDDAWIVKLTFDGTVEWDKTFGGDENDAAYEVEPAPGGGWILVGDTASRGEGNFDAAIWKVDATGTLVWEATAGGAQRDVAYDLVVLGDGSVVVAGSTSSKGAGKVDGWIVKLDPSGKQLWDRAYGGPEKESLRAIVALPDGGFAAAGNTSSKGAGKNDGWLIFVDAAGEPKSEHTFGDQEDELVQALARGNDGRFLLGGSRDDRGLVEGWIAFATPDGAQESVRVFDDLRRQVKDVIATSDGGWAIAGDYASMNSRYGNYWLLKLDPSGKGPN